MFKTMIAGVTALALSMTPVAAQDFNEDDFGKFLFGLVAAGALGAYLNKEYDAEPDRVHQPRMTHIPREPVVRDRSYRGDYINPRRAPRDHIVNPRRNDHPRGRHSDRDNGWNARDAKRLPRNCLQEIRTGWGSEPLFVRSCLNRNFRYVNSLPAKCETTLRSREGRRFGWDPQCLRADGYKLARR